MRKSFSFKYTVRGVNSMASATCPMSPRISTVAGVGATASMACGTLCMAGDSAQTVQRASAKLLLYRAKNRPKLARWLRWSAQLLHKDGSLFIYGPFKDHGEYTTESNQEFDQMIHSAGVAEWGLKDIADLEKAARDHALMLSEKIDMPTNNFGLIFSRA